MPLDAIPFVEESSPTSVPLSRPFLPSPSTPVKSQSLGRPSSTNHSIPHSPYARSSYSIASSPLSSPSEPSTPPSDPPPSVIRHLVYSEMMGVLGIIFANGLAALVTTEKSTEGKQVQHVHALYFFLARKNSLTSSKLRYCVAAGSHQSIREFYSKVVTRPN